MAKVMPPISSAGRDDDARDPGHRNRQPRAAKKSSVEGFGLPCDDCFAIGIFRSAEPRERVAGWINRFALTAAMRLAADMHDREFDVMHVSAERDGPDAFSPGVLPNLIWCFHSVPRLFARLNFSRAASRVSGLEQPVALSTSHGPHRRIDQVSDAV